MRVSEEKIRILRSALAELVGGINPDSSEELDSFEAILRVASAPEADKRVALNAIDALRQTIPS